MNNYDFRLKNRFHAQKDVHLVATLNPILLSKINTLSKK